MPKRVDITGKKYGHLTVVSLAEKIKGVRARPWIVSCAACGGEGRFAGATLRAGEVTSCGCLPRLNVGGFNLVAKMKKSGQRLCKSLPRADADAVNPEIRFFLEPSGKLVRRDAAQSAIEAHELTALGDGLFADQSQTWVAP